MAVSDYSTTASNNSSISGINIAENCSPAGINNAIRQMMADVRAVYDLTPLTTGTPTVSGGWTVSGTWTITGNMTFNDNVSARFGTGADTTILHNGTNTVVTDASAGLIVKTANFKVQNAAGTEDMLEATADGVVSLRHNNITRLSTTSVGISVAGAVQGTTITGSMVSTDISADTGSTTKVPHVAAVETYVAAEAKLALDTKQATTSGTAFDFTVPAGTKEIVVMFNGVSLSGADQFLVQIGDAGGFETTGYTSASGTNGGTTGSSTGFNVECSAAAEAVYGLMHLNLMDAASFLWVSSHGVTRNGTAIYGGGAKALSAELTQVRITRTGTNTFDAGEVNISVR